MDIGMMLLLFGNGGDFIHKVHRAREAGELKLPAYLISAFFVSALPRRIEFLEILLDLYWAERRNRGLARNAFLGYKIAHTA